MYVNNKCDTLYCTILHFICFYLLFSTLTCLRSKGVEGLISKDRIKVCYSYKCCAKQCAQLNVIFKGTETNVGKWGEEVEQDVPVAEPFVLSSWCYII